MVLHRQVNQLTTSSEEDIKRILLFHQLTTSSEEDIKRILQNADVNSTDLGGNTILMQALSAKKFVIARLIMQTGGC